MQRPATLCPSILASRPLDRLTRRPIFLEAFPRKEYE